MNDYEKNALLLSVARMYYEHSYNQVTIANKLNISRPYVSKLIQEARSLGIVNIIINDPLNSETALERRLRLQYQLLRAFVVPSTLGENTLTKVGSTAAKYLYSIVKKGDVIGISNGATVYNCAASLTPQDNLENVKVVQLTGEMINISHRIATTNNVRLFADALGATPYVLPLPIFFQNSKIKKAVYADKNIQKVADLQVAANIALFSLGAVGTVGTNSLIQSGYITQEQMDSLMKRGVTGDILSHFLNRHGEVCDKLLEDRMVSLPLHLLKQKEYRICLASGRAKLNVLQSALAGGYINVLVIDEELAKGIATTQE